MRRGSGGVISNEGSGTDKPLCASVTMPGIVIACRCRSKYKDDANIARGPDRNGDSALSPTESRPGGELGHVTSKDDLR